MERKTLFPRLAHVKKSAPVQASMHPLFEKASSLTERIIGAAIEVHRDKGPGLIEPIYEWCLTKELELRGLACLSQKVVVVTYQGFAREEPLRFDMLVDGCVLVEAKAAENFCRSTGPTAELAKPLDIPIAAHLP
jgi:GxxExxY protein